MEIKKLALQSSLSKEKCAVSKFFFDSFYGLSQLFLISSVSFLDTLSPASYNPVRIYNSLHSTEFPTFSET
jgi:hypothetical protein